MSGGGELRGEREWESSRERDGWERKGGKGGHT
jgi:hypothetical protein